MTALVEARGVCRHFPVDGGRRLRAVDGVDLRVDEGEIVGLVGESGCGKSTLGRTLLRLERPSAGTIHFGGVDITRHSERALRPLRRQMQIVFQDPSASLNPRRTVRQSILEPLLIHDLHSSRRPQWLVELLDQVGLSASLADRYPHELSGGQN